MKAIIGLLAAACLAVYGFCVVYGLAADHPGLILTATPLWVVGLLVAVVWFTRASVIKLLYPE